MEKELYIKILEQRKLGNTVNMNYVFSLELLNFVKKKVLKDQKNWFYGFLSQYNLTLRKKAYLIKN